jgi:NitT/TauT family transport system substrate-binding protein
MDNLRFFARRTRTREKFTVLVAALAFVVAPASEAADGCAKTFPVKVQEWPGDIINIVPWVAEEKGTFDRNCVDLKFVPLATGPGAIVGLVNGTIDFANGSPDNVMRSREKGVDVRVVANMYAGHWSALVAGNGLTLSDEKVGYPTVMKDLAGKKIGVTALGGSTEAYMRQAFEGAGMAPTSATYVAVGGVVTAVPALNGKVVDAAMMFGTGPELAEALGAGRIVVDYRKPGVGPKSLTALHGSTLTWGGYGPNIEKNPDMVAAFVKANNEAIAWIRDPKNRDEVYRIVAARMPLPDTVPNRDATLKRIVDVNAELLAAGVPPKSIEGWNSYLMSLKHTTKPMAYDEVVWKTGRP